jgi:hypothetical protein
VSDDRYPVEVLDPEDDDGTMPDNVAKLASAVIGRRIAKAEQRHAAGKPYRSEVTGPALWLTLDDGTQVEVADTSDCCAGTWLESFLLHPELVDHVILGVGTSDGFTTWHVYADAGDVLSLSVGWTAGNPFYYGYGFDIRVRAQDGEVTS